MVEKTDYIPVGLRVDVDTYRGTRNGVPQLLNTFNDFNIKASIFFSVGPDNMGRHLWRLLKPAFLLKMLRSNAASLYGLDILLRGTLWPGPKIGESFKETIKSAEKQGHEIGLHAWDHHHWQSKMETMSSEEIRDDILKGVDFLNSILEKPVTCSAVAGWKCNETVLVEKNAFWFRYGSDCRGKSIFRPQIDNNTAIPQIPVTLPTYDEVIGSKGISDINYNEYLLDLIKPGQLNVLTIHAEAEGIQKNRLFRAFLEQAKLRKIQFKPLGDLLPETNEIPLGQINYQTLEGREGRLCIQTN